MYLHRTLCSVLDEMRDLNKTRNFSPLLGLIEEAQSMANRMESKLYEIKDLENLHKEIRELEKKKDTLEKSIKVKS